MDIEPDPVLASISLRPPFHEWFQHDEACQYEVEHEDHFLIIRAACELLLFHLRKP